MRDIGSSLALPRNASLDWDKSVLTMHDPRLSALFDRYRREGDLSALAKLFDEISPEMMRVARHVAGRGVDPDDIVQSTFLASIERADTFDATRPIVPWLMGILINQARLMNRRRATRHEEPVIADVAGAEHEPDDAEAREVQDAVARALADLPATYREVLVAHLAEGKQPHEIAAQLGRPQGTVRAQLHRGLRIVRRSLPSGFAFGLAAMLDRNALAAVRREVLQHAARKNALPASAIPAAVSTSKVGLTVAAAAVVLAGVVGVAWFGGNSARADVDLGPDGSVPREPKVVELDGGPARSRASAAEEVAALPPTAIESKDIAAPTTGSVRVSVVDALGGAVVGAHIDLLAWGDPLWHERVLVRFTDAAGIAEFPRVAVGRVGAHLDGGGMQARADVIPGQRADIAIKLEAGIEFTGIVVDPHGVPVENAIVESGPNPCAAPRRISAPTGPDGRFVLRDAARTMPVWARADARPNSSAIWFGTPGHARTTAAELRFVLEDRVVPLAFTVVDASGARIEGAVVTAAEELGEPTFRADGSLVLARRGARAVADVDGRIEIAIDLTRTRHIAVEARNHARRELAVLDVGTLVQLQDGGRLAGVAHYSDGIVAVAAVLEARVDGLTEPLRTTSTTDGSFEILGVPAGPFVLSARTAPDAPVAETRGVVHGGQTFEWNPRLEHALVIRGTSRSAHGGVSKTWLVKAVREDAESAAIPDSWTGPAAPDLRQCWTGQDGRFTVPSAPGATYRLELRARAAWNGAVLGALDGVRAGAQDAELRVQVERGFLRARLLDASGALLQGSITVVRKASGAEQRFDSKPDGRIEGDVHPGTYALVAWPSGRAPLFLGERAFGTDERVDLGDVRLERTGTLRIRDAASSNAKLVNAAGFPRELSRSGADLVAWDLAPGDYAVKVPHAGGTAIELHGRVESGAELVLAFN